MLWISVWLFLGATVVLFIGLAVWQCAHRRGGVEVDVVRAVAGVDCPEACQDLRERVGEVACQSVFCREEVFPEYCNTNTCSLLLPGDCNEQQSIDLLTGCTVGTPQPGCMETCAHLDALSTQCLAPFCAEQNRAGDPCCTTVSPTYCSVPGLVAVINADCTDPAPTEPCATACNVLADQDADAACGTVACFGRCEPLPCRLNNQGACTVHELHDATVKYCNGPLLDVTPSVYRPRDGTNRSYYVAAWVVGVGAPCYGLTYQSPPLYFNGLYRGRNDYIAEYSATTGEVTYTLTMVPPNPDREDRVVQTTSHQNLHRRLEYKAPSTTRLEVSTGILLIDEQYLEGAPLASVGFKYDLLLQPGNMEYLGVICEFVSSAVPGLVPAYTVYTLRGVPNATFTEAVATNPRLV